MRTILLATALLAAGLASPAAASTFFPVTKTCPVGGEKFQFGELGSISTFGGLPDGMPIGSGAFPIALAQCPGNGLVLYRVFNPAEVERLATIIAGADYRAARRTDTPYHLAYRLAVALGDASAPWLLLSATWEAKNQPGDARAARYNAEFVALVASRPADATDLESIALCARAANALRELSRFDEAESLRRAIVIAPDAGKGREYAAENRQGWTAYLAALAAPIARRDADRAPIDLRGPREAAFRCAEPERKTDPGAPLTVFEREYCARPETAKAVDALRARLRGQGPD